MKDRIIEVMEAENLSSTMLADKLGVSRAVISHILNGRNNPSLDVVTRILQEMPYIDSDWLIMGSGKMLKDGVDIKSIQKAKDLFSQNDLNKPVDKEVNEKEQENVVKNPLLVAQSSDSKSFESRNINVRKISQIIIYYDDNTFETFYNR